MGFDTSFHPIPSALIGERLLPWILGTTEEDALDDLFLDALRISKVRFCANAWGLGVGQLSSPPEVFQPHLYIWGRPFLVTGSSTEQIAHEIDAWLTVPLSKADELAKQMLDQLHPQLGQIVQKSTGGTLPPDHKLLPQIRAVPRLMRDCVHGVRTQTPTINFNGSELDPAQVLTRDLTSAVLGFAAVFRPGWMSRGLTWPTHLLHSHPVRNHFSMNLELIHTVVNALPELEWVVEDTITENYSVGGCASLDHLGEIREALQSLTDPDYQLEVQKLREALSDAIFRGLPFAEATEIYSGFGGVLN